MILRGIAPNTDTFTSATALQGQARQQRLVLALLMLDVMRGLLERGDQRDDPSRRDFTHAQRVTKILTE